MGSSDKDRNVNQLLVRDDRERYVNDGGERKCDSLADDPVFYAVLTAVCFAGWLVGFIMGRLQ